MVEILKSVPSWVTGRGVTNLNPDDDKEHDVLSFFYPDGLPDPVAIYGSPSKRVTIYPGDVAVVVIIDTWSDYGADDVRIVAKTMVTPAVIKARLDHQEACRYADAAYRAWDVEKPSREVSDHYYDMIDKRFWTGDRLRDAYRDGIRQAVRAALGERAQQTDPR